MADGAAPPPAGQGAQPTSSVVIPDDVRAQHGELVTLILQSESMNDEERQYWVNILPIMTPEQVQNLREILENERRQLQAIDQKYAQQSVPSGTPADQAAAMQRMEEARLSRLSERREAETTGRQSDDVAADDLLKQIDAA
jgi:hypothetical protein